MKQCLGGFVLAFIVGHAVGVRADIFEHVRPADTALREVLTRDHRAYYWQTPGMDHQENQERISQIRALESGQRIRPAGLHDMDKAFDIYLTQQLRGDRDHKGSIASSHPLVLLEYASPVLADVLKHYRVTSYGRLAIEQARLNALERSTESSVDRLARQSEQECLQLHESKGLVAAMRVCQSSMKPFDGLRNVDRTETLEDGRRRVHVVAEALARLGLERRRIDAVVELTGETIISNDSNEERLPETSFERKAAYSRQVLVRKWREIFVKFQAAGRAGAAKLEELSLPGAPATVAVLADLGLLDEDERTGMIYKFASLQAFLETGRMYRQAMAYMDLCGRDPVLTAVYRGIVLDKKYLLSQALLRAERDRGGVEGYKELLAVLARAADSARQRMQERVEPPAALSVQHPEFMLDL